ncbi:MAG: family 2 glycosyl transferase, partial [Peptostreptococcaceae bacterium]
GNKNSYKAYLKDLINHYEDRPVIVSEFGIPTSRGITHEDLSRGFNQGMVDEASQGHMNTQMLEDINSTGYAGAIVFSWQDEWFKRTWNTMDLDDEHSRPYWLDKMTNEEMFGILSFDPGKRKSTSYNDGNVREWKKENIISSGNNIKLYMKSDEEYLYFRINKKDLDLSNEEIVIPIDITPKSGSKKIEGYNLELNNEADFIINISEGKGSIKVNEYYDVNNYFFNKIVQKNKNSDKFNIVKQTIQGESKVPKTNTVIEKKEVEVGHLINGNGNPKSKNYNSLSDYIVNKDDIEIRIPWLMLNVTNPCEKKVMDDFNIEKEIKHINIDEIHAGAYVLENNNLKDFASMEAFSWEKWDMPVYHERLKPSYYILKDAFKNID